MLRKSLLGIAASLMAMVSIGGTVFTGPAEAGAQVRTA
jgi:hypothetical protein